MIMQLDMLHKMVSLKWFKFLFEQGADIRANDDDAASLKHMQMHVFGMSFSDKIAKIFCTKKPR